MIPLVFTSSSPGAPVLTGQDGSLYSILKWALSELGWTLEFDDSANFRAAFRTGMPHGSGYFLRIRDKGADHGWGDSRYMAVQGFSSMTDVNAGADGFPSSDQYFAKSRDTDATSHTWAIIGTNTFFWWLPNIGGAGHQWYWAGDYVPFAPDDISNFCIGSTASPTSSSSATATPFEEVSAFPVQTIVECAATRRSGIGVGVDQSPVAAMGSNETSDSMGSDGIYPDPFSGSVNVSRIELADKFESRARRGVLPGILNPMADLRVSQQSDFKDLDIIPGLSNGRVAADLQFVALNRSLGTFNDSRIGSALFDVNNDWGADW